VQFWVAPSRITPWSRLAEGSSASGLPRAAGQAEARQRSLASAVAEVERGIAGDTQAHRLDLCVGLGLGPRLRLRAGPVQHPAESDSWLGPQGAWVGRRLKQRQQAGRDRQVAPSARSDQASRLDSRSFAARGREQPRCREGKLRLEGGGAPPTAAWRWPPGPSL